MNKPVARSGKGFFSALLTLFPTLAMAESAEAIQTLATQINGESLMYFMLLLFIAYLFFRKPLP